MDKAVRLPRCVVTPLCLMVLLAARSEAAADPSTWLPYTMPDVKKLKGTALDMSFLLDAPAGKHGFLTVKGDKFVFQDGTEARFWGGNIYAEANFPTRKQAEALAQRIAATGANIVRMHHLDVVAPWTDMIIRKNFWGGQSPDSTRVLDREMLDRFDYLVHCFKRHGIYIFLSHLSSRRIMPGDGLPDPADSLDDILAGLKIEGEFDDCLIQLQQEYLKQVLTHRNPYTGLPLAGDPVLAMTEIINEDSLLYLGASTGFNTNSDHYKQMLQGQFNDWLAARYTTREALAKAWQPQDGEGKGLNADEDPSRNTVAFSYRWTDDPKTRYDPAWSRRRNIDMYAFLCDTQKKYYDRMYQFMRSLGARCPITGSNHWISDVADLYLNTSMDYIDRHEYYAHPHGNYNYVEGQQISPVTPMVKADWLGAIAGLAGRRIYGKPYTVSEWDNCLPNPYRAEGPVFMAAYASLQDWHPMQYAYLAFINDEPKTINSFMVFYDPAHMNLLPASALMFHRRDIKEAPTSYFEPVAARDVIDPAFTVNRNARVALLGKYGLAFDDAAGGLPTGNEDLLQQASDGTRRVFESVTGQIRWDFGQGLLTVNTPRTQAVVGFPHKLAVAMGDAFVDIDNDFAVVVISALQGESIRSAERLLVSTSARAQWSGMEFDEQRGVITESGRPPFLMEPVTGKVTIKHDTPMRMYALSSSGRRIGEVPVQKTAEGIAFEMLPIFKCMHYELVQ